MSNFTPLRIFGIAFGLLISVFGIGTAIIPATFIFKPDADKTEYILLDGTVSRVEFITGNSRASRNSITTYYVSIDIIEFPDFIFYGQDRNCFSTDEIRMVSQSFAPGDSISMLIEKVIYENKLSKKIPDFPSNPRSRMEEIAINNYKFIEVFGFRKGSKDLLSDDECIKRQNSPAGFFSYLFFGIAVCMIFTGLLIAWKIYRKAQKTM